jgi:hypothetical protein
MDQDKIQAEAAQKLAAGDAHGAFATLRPLLEHPSPVADDARQLARALSAFAEIAERIAGAELASTMRRTSGRCDDIEVLYAAAYALYDQKLHGFAATLLTRADRLAPRQARIVVELCSNLEALLAYHEARQRIDELPADAEPFVTYLGGFYALMCGDLEAARLRVHALRDAQGETAFMRDELAAMLARADAVAAAGISLGEHALTAWHAIINGSLLLHESPHGYDKPMRGRYAFVSDSPQLMRLGIERLARVLGARRPARVVSAPDRASRILARAVARAIDLPLAEWHPGAAAGGLYVAWDLDGVGDSRFLIDLKKHANDQILFVHACAWVDPPGYAPDVTTLLYQSITHPYLGGAPVASADGKQLRRQEPDARDEEALAAEILALPPDDDSAVAIDRGLEIVAALDGLVESQRLGLRRGSGARRRVRAGSPVVSARFW